MPVSPSTDSAPDRVHPSDSARACLEPGKSCWRLARAGRFALIVDAAEYFAFAKQAMERARRSIVLVGWDFDLRIKLTPDGDDASGENELGPFLRSILKRRPDLEIFILKWDMAVLYTLTRQVLPLLALDWTTPRRLHLRFDSNHPWTAAHHQKIAVIDDSMAFCGGIDMTSERWDTRAHRPGEPFRLRPDGSSYGPWHDATVAVDGEAARALGTWVRRRWKLATGKELDPPPTHGDVWPAGLKPQLRDVEVGIARTMPAHNGRSAIREIENLYIAAIRSARRYIYLESQYFASLRICEAIAGRLRETNGPEVVVINPRTAEGWLEQNTMGAARAVCLARIQKSDHHGRFAIFYPVNAHDEPIYVHAKILVVDDRLLRVGSSNINNRSLGFDSECDLAVEATGPQAGSHSEAIRAVRDDLLAEHLDRSPAEFSAAVKAEGSILGAIRKLMRAHGRSLRPLPWAPASSLDEAIVVSRLADPERPKLLEKRATHLVKRLMLRVPPSAVCAAAVLIGGVALAKAIRRR